MVVLVVFCDPLRAVRRAVRDRAPRRRRDPAAIPAARRRRARAAPGPAHARAARRGADRSSSPASNAGLQAEIAERRLADQRVVHMAHHDALTGLPNRTLLADRVGQAIARAHRRGGKLAVLFLDLDRFKNVNDSLGHAIGDLLLTAVAARLTDCLREEDTAARLGGDEFIISLPDVADAGRGRQRRRPHPRRARQAVHDRRAPAARRRQHRHRPVSRRRRHRRDADAQRRHGDVSRQGVGARQLPVLQRADDRAREPPPLDRDRPAARARARRVHAALPAADRPGRGAHRAAPRRCCAGRSRTSVVMSPAEFIPIAEDTGPHHPARRMGAARGLRAGAGLAGAASRAADRRQSLGAAVPAEGPDRHDRARARRNRPRPGACWSSS